MNVYGQHAQREPATRQGTGASGQNAPGQRGGSKSNTTTRCYETRFGKVQTKHYASGRSRSRRARLDSAAAQRLRRDGERHDGESLPQRQSRRGSGNYRWTSTVTTPTTVELSRGDLAYHHVSQGRLPGPNREVDLLDGFPPHTIKADNDISVDVKELKSGRMVESRTWIVAGLRSAPPPAPRTAKKRPCIDTGDPARDV